MVYGALALTYETFGCPPVLDAGLVTKADCDLTES
jgi:hypothetical protein